MALIVSLLLLKTFDMVDCMEIAESIYEDVVETSCKKKPGKTPTTLVSSGIRAEKPPHNGLAPRRLRVLASAENYIYISRWGNRNLSHPHPKTFFRKM